MMDKHTPGPWKVYDQQVLDFPRQLSIQATNDRWTETLADLRLQSVTALPVEANARLIAAAPELLEALEHIRSYCRKQVTDNSPEALLWAQCESFTRAAIARAKGLVSG